MNALAKTTQNGVSKVDTNKLASVEKFQKKLNVQPKKEEVKTNKFAGNSKYLPISFIEMTLDEMFFGHWQVENFQYQVVSNELIGSLELVFLHPVTHLWLRRTGAAAVPIQMKSGSSVLDVQNKIVNTLVKDFPHLKASCLANAARSVGKIFGRDLNRKENDTYQPIVLPHHQKQVDNIRLQFENAQSLKDLEAIFQENQEKILADTSLVSAYNLAKKTLTL